MSAQDKVSYFIRVIEEFNALKEKLPKLISRVELGGESLKEELELLLKIKESLIDKGWFDKTWDQYLYLKERETLSFFKKNNFFIVLRMQARDHLDFTSVKFRIIEPLEKYLAHNTNKNKEVIIFFKEYIRLVEDLRLMFVGDPTPYKQAAEELFWEKNKPKKIRYQRMVVIDKYKTINLRMVFLPKSKMVNLNAQSYSEKKVIIDFVEYYMMSNITPDEFLSLFFEELCKITKNIMADETITRYYGNSFAVSLQVELRCMDSAGLFDSLMSTRKGIMVTIFPDYNYLMISLMTNYLFDYKGLEFTLYHEIIHNLDLRYRKEVDTFEYISGFTLIRIELIAVMLTALREKNVSPYIMDMATIIFEQLKLQPISSIRDYEAIINQCGGKVHPLSFLVGLQLLCASLKLGNGRDNPQKMFFLVMNSKEKAIATMKIFMALSPKLLFRYYRKKVPRRAQCFSKEFLDYWTSD